MRNRRNLLSVQSLVIALSVVVGCSGATLKTFVDPSLTSSQIRTVAIFPIRNVRLLPDESRELNRGFVKTFHDKNPAVRILGPVEATDSLNARNLVEKYSDFLRNYAASGIPDSRVLHEIGAALNADAFIQGEVFDISQKDGEFGSHVGQTRLTVRYTMMDVNKGTVLWEATSDARKETATTLSQSPPLYEAIEMAQKEILASLPTLGQ